MSATKDRFEDYLSQVELAVQELESGNLPLEESIKKYELGVKALQQCYKILDSAERKIQELVKDEAGRLELKPLEGGKAEETEPQSRPARKPAKPAEPPPKRPHEDEEPF